MKLHALIAEQTVVGPDERLWTVGIRWLPRQPHWLGWGPGRTTTDGPRPDPEWLAVMNGFVPDDFPVLLVIAAVIAALVFAWFVILPIAIFALDLLFVVLLAAAGVAAHVLFGRPWIVEATTAGELRRRPVVGYGSSRKMVTEVAWSIRTGGDVSQH